MRVSYDRIKTLIREASEWSGEDRIGGAIAVIAHTAYHLFMRAALLECLRRMQTAGMNRVCVSTGETNTPARRLYESVGFRVVNRYLDYVKSVKK